MLKHEPGIYAVVNNSRGKYYIGGSNDVYKRTFDHKGMLQVNIHFNSKLQKDWNLQNGEGFDFIVLEYCGYGEISQKEIEHMAKYEPECLYNIEPGGINKSLGDQVGGYIKKSDEMCDKLSKVQGGGIIIGTRPDGSKIYFKYAAEAKRYGFDPSCIMRCVNGERPHHKGLTWDKIETVGSFNSEKSKPIIATNLKTGEQLFFKSIGEANESGFLSSGIRRALHGKFGCKQHRGYSWRFASEEEIIKFKK